MSTLIEKNARLKLLGPPLKRIQHLMLVPVLLLALVGWFIPGFWDTGLFSLFAITVFCLAGALREIIRLRILKQHVAPDVYKQTVLKVGRVSIIGSLIPIFTLYVGTVFPQYGGISFTIFLMSIIVAYLIVSRLNKQAKQLDPAFVTMREIERYRK